MCVCVMHVGSAFVCILHVSRLQGRYLTWEKSREKSVFFSQILRKIMYFSQHFGEDRFFSKCSHDFYQCTAVDSQVVLVWECADAYINYSLYWHSDGETNELL